MMGDLPALEVIEEAVKSMAGMCSGFHKQLIRDGVPPDVAKAMAVEFASQVAQMMKPQQGS